MNEGVNRILRKIVVSRRSLVVGRASRRVRRASFDRRGQVHQRKSGRTDSATRLLANDARPTTS